MQSASSSIPTRSYSKFILISIVSLSLSVQACSKKKPDQPTIQKYCHDKILATIQKKPLSRIEKSFFKDGRSRGILKADHQLLTSLKEDHPRRLRLVQEFSFVDYNDKTVKLVSSEENGGIDVNGGNLVTPRIQCTVTWGLFKGEVMRDQLRVIMVKLDRLQQKMRELDSLVEGSW